MFSIDRDYRTKYVEKIEIRYVSLIFNIRCSRYEYIYIYIWRHEIGIQESDQKLMTVPTWCDFFPSLSERTEKEVDDMIDDTNKIMMNEMNHPNVIARIACGRDVERNRSMKNYQSKKWLQ